MDELPFEKRRQHQPVSPGQGGADLLIDGVVVTVSLIERTIEPVVSAAGGEQRALNDDVGRQGGVVVGKMVVEWRSTQCSGHAHDIGTGADIDDHAVRGELPYAQRAALLIATGGDHGNPRRPTDLCGNGGEQRPHHAAGREQGAELVLIELEQR